MTTTWSMFTQYDNLQNFFHCCNPPQPPCVHFALWCCFYLINTWTTTAIPESFPNLGIIKAQNQLQFNIFIEFFRTPAARALVSIYLRVIFRDFFVNFFKKEVMCLRMFFYGWNCRRFKLLKSRSQIRVVMLGNGICLPVLQIFISFFF